MLEEILKRQSSWEYLKEVNKPIILYGTGNGADKVIDELENLNISLSGVMASDGFVRKRSFRGFEVKNLSYFEENFDDFVIILGFGSQRDEVLDYIKEISSRHKLLVPCVPVFGEDIINREFLEKNRDKIEETYEILADSKSKEVFKDFLLFELTGNIEYQLRSETDKQEAFTEILTLNGNENYLDLGAYKGDTVEEFLYFTNNGYSSITAIEADKKNFKKLEINTSSLKNCKLINAAVWSGCDKLSFTATTGRSGSVGDGNDEIQAVSVDSLNGEFSYIKVDIEGAEMRMLQGAENTLKKYKPKLNLAAYHRSEDTFSLALKIHEINPEYKVYLRHHKYIPCWDLNFYCI